MSVLLAYGTSTEAVIMSDSRTTLYKNKNGTGKIGHKEKTTKIFKINDKFIIGHGGFGKSKDAIIALKYYLESYYSDISIISYEEILDEFVKRIDIYKVASMPYSVYIIIGIDSNGRVRMDTYNNEKGIFESVYPSGNTIINTIYLPPSVNDEFRIKFNQGISMYPDTEKFCESVIQKISEIDDTVNDRIQKFKIHI